MGATPRRRSSRNTRTPSRLGIDDTWGTGAASNWKSTQAKKSNGSTSSPRRSPRRGANKGTEGDGTGTGSLLLGLFFALPVYLYFFVYFNFYLFWLLEPSVVSQYVPSAIATQIPFYMATAASAGDQQTAILTDIALLAAFMIPHTILARISTKVRMGLPMAAERTIYVLQSTALLHVQMMFWKDFDGPKLWDVRDIPKASQAIHALFVVGWLFLLSATFAIDHFRLTGLTQAFGVDLNEKLGLAGAANKSGIVVRFNYAIVAHPIMTGMIIAVWSTPVMTAPRLLFAVCNTAYMVYAVKMYEEPAIEKLVGKKAYTAYLQTVPSFCPLFLKAR